MADRDISSYRSEPTPAELYVADAVEDADLRFMLDHWRKLKGARRMPTRAEIVAKDVKRCLRHMHIYDVINGGADFRARLVGTAVYPHLDEDQTGKLISKHPDPGVRLRFAAIMRRVVETGEPVRSRSLRVTGNPLYDAQTEGLWLPLGRGEKVEQILAQSSLHALKPQIGRRDAD